MSNLPVPTKEEALDHMLDKNVLHTLERAFNLNPEIVDSAGGIYRRFSETGFVVFYRDEAGRILSSSGKIGSIALRTFDNVNWSILMRALAPVDILGRQAQEFIFPPNGKPSIWQVPDPTAEALLQERSLEIYMMFSTR
ncbi:MAG: hypothetical protein WCJ29_05420 [bacterium]